MKRTPRQKAMRTTRFRRLLNEKGHTRLWRYRVTGDPSGDHTEIICRDCYTTWRLFDSEVEDPRVWPCSLHRARMRAAEEAGA